MARDYRNERDMVIRRWYGHKPLGRNPIPERTWVEGPISPADGFGIENLVNAPIPLFGHCLAWRYALNSEGYGTQIIDGERFLVHRAVYKQTRGEIPSGKQINHLCDRPYCFQPNHLYAGTARDNADDARLFRSSDAITDWEIAQFGQHGKESSLRQRLRETDRYDSSATWDPIEHPPQRHLGWFYL